MKTIRIISLDDGTKDELNFTAQIMASFPDDEGTLRLKGAFLESSSNLNLTEEQENDLAHKLIDYFGTQEYDVEKVKTIVEEHKLVFDL